MSLRECSLTSRPECPAERRASTGGGTGDRAPGSPMATSGRPYPTPRDAPGRIACSGVVVTPAVKHAGSPPDMTSGIDDPAQVASRFGGGDDQFARVPSKSIVACVPWQNGLLDEWPQRHMAIGSGCSITCPSDATRVTSPETMNGPDEPWGFADPSGWRCSARYCGTTRVAPAAVGCEAHAPRPTASCCPAASGGSVGLLRGASARRSRPRQGGRDD
jgi:hypothetical protein